MRSRLRTPSSSDTISLIHIEDAWGWVDQPEASAGGAQAPQQHTAVRTAHSCCQVTTLLVKGQLRDWDIAAEHLQLEDLLRLGVRVCTPSTTFVSHHCSVRNGHQDACVASAFPYTRIDMCTAHRPLSDGRTKV